MQQEELRKARKAKRWFSLLTWLSMSYTLFCSYFFVCFIILPTMLPNHTTFRNEVTHFMVSHNNPFFKYLWFALTNQVKVCHHTCYINLRADRSADTSIRCGYKCEVKITGDFCSIWRLPVSHCWETYLSSLVMLQCGKLPFRSWMSWCDELCSDLCSQYTHYYLIRIVSCVFITNNK